MIAKGAIASYARQYVPQLVTVLREGYRFSHFRADALAALTVVIVALPLSMAIAVASGASPAQGLYTAIIGGCLVSALGGSRFQIAGPAGAFIVLVAATVQAHGMDGLLLATVLAGLMLFFGGLLGIGTYIKFIPYPVTIGFTAGIAVIILASQGEQLLGLTLPNIQTMPLAGKLQVIWQNLPQASLATILVSCITIAVIVLLRKFRPNWPGMLAAIVLASLLVVAFDLPTETIGSRFGAFPTGFPAPALPDLSLARIMAVLPNAVALALLGAIESLLSAVVADGMSGQRHRPNSELAAQGIANIASGLFGGICVTGAIARTATNVRAGAHGPVSGILHGLFILLFIFAAARLAGYIPLAALAGVLAVVAWNMVEKHAIATLLRSSFGDAVVLAITFLLTILVGLTEAIVVGFALGSALFIQRMSKIAAVEAMPAESTGQPYDTRIASDPDIMVYRISGAVFFGAAASIGLALERTADRHRVLLLDFAAVSFLDSTAANTVASLAQRSARRGIRLFITGTSEDVRRQLFVHGVRPPAVRYEQTVARALRLARRGLR